MKSHLTIGVLSGALLAMLATPSSSQTPVPTPAEPPITSRPVIVPPALGRPDLPKRPDRPVVPGQPVQSQQIKDLVREFQAARQAFLQQQQELNRQLKASSDVQRAIIREQLKENLRRWMEQQKAQIQELKEQAKEMNRVSKLIEVIGAGTPEGGRPTK